MVCVSEMVKVSEEVKRRDQEVEGAEKGYKEREGAKGKGKKKKNEKKIEDMEKMEWLKLEVEVIQTTRVMTLCHSSWASRCNRNSNDLGSESST